MDMVIGLVRTAGRPAPFATTLERAAATLHEAILNQELTSMLIAAQRLYNLARAHRHGPMAWHAAAIAALCSEQPDDTARLSQLMAGIESTLEATR